MKTINFCLILCAWLFLNLVNAQDKIVFKSGEVVDGYVILKSDKEIKYKLIDSENSPIVIIKTNKVQKITYRNGVEMNIIPDVIRMDKRFGIGTGLVYLPESEAAFYKFQADYYLSQGFNLEVNGVLEMGLGTRGMFLGLKYLFDPYSPKKLKGYAGLLAGAISQDFVIQVPIGLHYVTKSGFDARLGLSGFYIPNDYGFGFFTELTIGWRF